MAPCDLEFRFSGIFACVGWQQPFFVAPLEISFVNLFQDCYVNYRCLESQQHHVLSNKGLIFNCKLTANRSRRERDGLQWLVRKVNIFSFIAKDE
jgi:hypothetical protein